MIPNNHFLTILVLVIYFVCLDILLVRSVIYLKGVTFQSFCFFTIIFNSFYQNGYFSFEKKCINRELLLQREQNDNEMTLTPKCVSQ